MMDFSVVNPANLDVGFCFLKFCSHLRKNHGESKINHKSNRKKKRKMQKKSQRKGKKLTVKKEKGKETKL